ncbi:MAG: SHOCT domain-containing protein [Bacillota bacterium]
MGLARSCFGPNMMYGGGSFMMILFWGILIIAGIYLFKSLKVEKKAENNNSGTINKNYKESEMGPEEIARKRYAKGEIDREEFNKIQNDLKK